MQLKVGQVWEDGNPYPNWKYIKIDSIADNSVRYTVLNENHRIYERFSNELDNLIVFMKQQKYTLAKSSNFSNLYDKLCSTN